VLRPRPLLNKALTILVLLMISSACAKKPQTGVSLQNLRADIVFGVKEPLGPANFLEPSQPLEETAEFSSDLPSPASRGGTAPVPRPAAPACPEASRTAAVPEEAPPSAKGLPGEGSYLWKYEGTQEITAARGVKFTLNGFERRTVSGIQRFSDSQWRFTVTQKELSGDIVATQYQVKNAAASARAPQTTVRTGEVDRGLAIAGITRFDGKSGAAKSRFVPNPPVLILPLPVLPAEEFQAAGVDPASSNRERLAVQGKVIERRSVDACGDLIDGWLVEMTQTFSTSDGGDRVRKFNMIVATQMGALPILETVETQDANGKVNVTFNIGQTKPDPVS
jgi:hypothetical protein